MWHSLDFSLSYLFFFIYINVASILLSLWILTFVNELRLSVSIDGKLSRICDIKCGVPQGSVLGPLLFLILINDLPLVLSENVHSIDLYADDTTIYDMQSDFETL